MRAREWSIGGSTNDRGKRAREWSVGGGTNGGG